MHLWQACTLGIVQGVTEFLPVSSTGHLILVSRLLGLDQTNFLKSFEISIQLGSILSVVILYGRSLSRDMEILKKISAAFVTTALLGLAVYHHVKKYFLGNYEVVAVSLFAGGIFLVFFELLHKEQEGALEAIAKLSYPKAVCLGLFQSLAFVPGVSRAAATIIGGLLLGLKRKTIVEFSFLLAVPTMLAATGLDLLKNAGSFSFDQFVFLAVGFVTSFLVSLAAIKFLLQFIKNHNFVPFGVYRIAIAFLFWHFFIK